MSNIGSSKIAEMYVGSTKIAQAYLGSTLVFQISQPPAGYDSYVIHLTWGGADQFVMAGLHVDGVQPSASDVTLQYYYVDRWITASSSDMEAAILWQDYYQGTAFFCEAIDITFNSANIPSTVQVKTGTWYAGGSMPVTMHVAGVKNGVETDLGYTRHNNEANLIYTVNINDND